MDIYQLKFYEYCDRWNHITFPMTLQLLTTWCSYYSDKLLAINYHNYLVTVTSLLHNTLHNTYREFSSYINLELPSWCTVNKWPCIYVVYKLKTPQVCIQLFHHFVWLNTASRLSSLHSPKFTNMAAVFCFIKGAVTWKNSVGPPYTTEIEMFSFCNTLFVSVSLAHIGSTYLADSTVALI